MADETFDFSLPADLPEDWEYGQVVAPEGADAGLSEQHGFNYLNRQINNTQKAVNRLGAGSYTRNQVDGKLAGKSNTNHTHDDRYYTEAEVDGKLAGKSNTNHTHNYAGSGSAGGAANSACRLEGFATQEPSQLWGNQTGTFIHGENDSTGGSLAFRRDNPIAGELSLIIDGRFYQDEGKYMCLDTNNYSSYALPLAGGTMTGDIAFTGIGDTGTSKKITWSGSTDAADIYYQTTAADQGNLVINLRDDSNCYLRIACNGVFKSYFSPSDGNFHGNVNGNASTSSSCTGNSATATTAAKLGRDGATGTPMTFNWSGQSGQPSWLWGGNDGANMYVYNPSNFSVNYAKTSGNLPYTITYDHSYVGTGTNGSESSPVKITLNGDYDALVAIAEQTSNSTENQRQSVLYGLVSDDDSTWAIPGNYIPLKSFSSSKFSGPNPFTVTNGVWNVGEYKYSNRTLYMYNNMYPGRSWNTSGYRWYIFGITWRVSL